MRDFYVLKLNQENTKLLFGFLGFLKKELKGLKLVMELSPGSATSISQGLVLQACKYS